VSSFAMNASSSAVEWFAGRGMVDRKLKLKALDAFKDGRSRERDDDIIDREIFGRRRPHRTDTAKDSSVPCCPQSSLSHSTSSPALSVLFSILCVSLFLVFRFRF